MKIFYFILPALLINFPSHSQNFAPDLSIPVTVNGNILKNAWAGGMDNPQFSAIDLNGDGIKDLFVFEEEGASSIYFRYTTYINQGTLNSVDYHYAPQYISKFPKYMHNWALLSDYNCDGNEDIFTASNDEGVMVYKNITTTGLQFALEDSELRSVYLGFPSTLYVQRNDLAAFIDVDGDGDMDILAPGQGVNAQLNYNRNYSMENYGVCDSLIFSADTINWGGINFGAGNDGVSFLAFDNDGDGDKDLLTDDAASFPAYNYLNYYENTGTALNVNLVLSDDSFPSYNIPAHIRIYPAAYYLDADNDGKKDLIVSPLYHSVSENVHNAYFYKDTSSTVQTKFNMITDEFLVGEMVDVGSGAYVRFFDVDNDGLQDIIIGNYEKREKNLNDSTSLWYFRNTGTATLPAFQLVTNNYANSMADDHRAMSPTFGDIDGDGDADMLVGVDDGTIVLYTNTGGNFSLTSTNYQGIDAGSYSTPYLFDVNQDGLIDLICGNKLGMLSYYQNTGTSANPVFTLMNSFWGGVNVTDTLHDIYGYSYPFIYDKNGSLELLVGSLKGNIFRYGNITGNLGGTFTLLDTMYGNINEPIYLTVDGSDINGDGMMDLLTGNFAGGITLYKQLPVSVKENANDKAEFTIYPNPANSTIIFTLNESANVVITNLFGQIVFEKNNNTHGKFELNVSFLSPGIYFIKAGSRVSKFVKE